MDIRIYDITNNVYWQHPINVGDPKWTANNAWLPVVTLEPPSAGIYNWSYSHPAFETQTDPNYPAWTSGNTYSIDLRFRDPSLGPLTAQPNIRTYLSTATFIAKPCIVIQRLTLMPI